MRKITVLSFLLSLFGTSAAAQSRFNQDRSAVLSLMNSITGLELSTTEELALFLLLWFIFSGFAYIFVRQVVAKLETGELRPDDHEHKVGLNLGLSLSIGAAAIILIGNNLGLIALVGGSILGLIVLYKAVKYVETGSEGSIFSLSSTDDLPDDLEQIERMMELIESEKRELDKLLIHTKAMDYAVYRTGQTETNITGSEPDYNSKGTGKREVQNLLELTNCDSLNELYNDAIDENNREAVLDKLGEMVQQTASSVERLESSLSNDFKERMLLEALRDRLQEANGKSQYSSTLTDEQEEAVNDLANEVVRFYQTQEPKRLLTDAEEIRESANNSVSNLNQYGAQLDIDNGQEIADILNEVLEASTYIVRNRQEENGGTIPSSEITAVINEISNLL